MHIGILVDAEQRLGMQRPTVLIIGRETCDDCLNLFAQLEQWQTSMDVEVVHLDLTTEIAQDFKAKNTWVQYITAIPFTVIYRHGEPIDQWTGGDVARIESRVQSLVS